MPRERASSTTLAGLLGYYALVSGGYLYLTLGSGALRWPFTRASSASDALVHLAAYAPVLALSLLSLWFVRASGTAVAPLFARPRFDAAAYCALGACTAYAVFMLAQHPAPFVQPACWPALLMLCAMNSVAEETLYRGTFMAVLDAQGLRPTLVLVLQSLAYALPHLAIAAQLAAAAFVFGLLLGWLRRRSGSLWPSIILHAVADVGAIGLPFLPIA